MKKALQFHRITPKFQFCGTWNTPRQFVRFLDELIRMKVDIDLPGKSDKGVVICFDDGEETIYKYAFPILKKYNIQALVFLVVDYIGKDNLWDISITGEHVRHLSWSQIYEMKEWGIEFGSHTMTHQNLTIMTEDKIDYEVGESKRILDQKLGDCQSISYPFNRVNKTVVQAAQKAGYTYGFGWSGLNNLTLKKEGIYITDTRRTLQVKVFEKPAALYWYDRIKQKVINMFTITTMLRKGK
jgi:peptidoglycan/xylan/chitin deacetylase (PgdA/CDA1 family)